MFHHGPEIAADVKNVIKWKYNIFQVSSKTYQYNRQIGINYFANSDVLL